MTGLTSTGFSIDRLDAIIAAYVAAYTEVFGPFDSDPDTIDGETIGILAESQSNLQQLAEAVYQSFNPQTATGAALSRLVQYNGIRRQLASFGTVVLQLTGDPNTLVPAGSLVTAADGTSVWATNVDAPIDNSGTVLVQATCTVVGPIVAAPATLTTISSPVFGLQSVTNPSAATKGTNEETDGELRLRRAASTETAAQGIPDSIEGKIANVAGVTQTKLYENYTDAVDANGMTPHSIMVVVVGGLDQDILNALWLKRSTGVTRLGNTSGTVLDVYGNPHTETFQRPADVPVYVTVNVHPGATYPTDGDQQIKAAIVAWAILNLLIGTTVVWSELFTPINTVPGVSVRGLFTGLAPAPAGTADLAILFDAAASIAAANIVVNHV